MCCLISEDTSWWKRIWAEVTPASLLCSQGVCRICAHANTTVHNHWWNYPECNSHGSNYIFIVCEREMMSYLCVSISQVVVLILKKAITDLRSLVTGVTRVGFVAVPTRYWGERIQTAGELSGSLFSGQNLWDGCPWRTDMAWYFLTNSGWRKHLFSVFICVTPPTEAEQQHESVIKTQHMYKRWCHPPVVAFMIITINTASFWTTSS